MRNFDEISNSDVTYDNINRHKKTGFHRTIEDTFSEKQHGGGVVKLTPPLPLPSVLRVNMSCIDFHENHFLKYLRYLAVILFGRGKEDWGRKFFEYLTKCVFEINVWVLNRNI